MTESQSTSPTEISPTASDEAPEIVLISAEEAFWLVDGEDHLDALLKGPEGYPTPVGCILFPSIAALEAELGVPIKEADMWSIHPAIIARLREDAHLLEITAAPG